MEAISRRAAIGALGGVALGARAVAAVGQSALAAAGALTDVDGLRVGHFTDTRRPTGCTAILFDKPATAGVDYDGSAPGESLGVALQPVSPVDQIHAILLTGGGPMALGATAGVVRYLEERTDRIRLGRTEHPRAARDWRGDRRPGDRRRPHSRRA